MRHTLSIATVLLWSIALLAQAPESGQNKSQSLSQTWKGTLLDAGCKEVRDSVHLDSTRPPSGQSIAQNEENKKTKDPVKSLPLVKRSFENCGPKPTTTEFALMSDGKIFRFDEAGNSDIRDQLKSNEKVKQIVESGQNKAVLVSVTGSMDKNVIHLSSVSFNDQQ